MIPVKCSFRVKELLALDISALRFPGEQAVVAEQMSQANDTGILFEARHVRKDGSVIAVEVSSRGATMKGERILLSIIRDIIELKQAEDMIHMENLGYKILTAQSGRKAIELFREHVKDIKLVILDMIMPEMNGRETLVKLMEIDSKVRVLLSSGYSINGEAAGILNIGCKGSIQKPFRVEKLSRKIRDVIDCGDL
jgi:CheY-like chemotaxis protein